MLTCVCPALALLLHLAMQPSRVVTLSSSDDEVELVVAPNGGMPKLAFQQLSAPVMIDLTLEDDLCCMVRGVGSGWPGWQDGGEAIAT